MDGAALMTRAHTHNELCYSRSSNMRESSSTCTLGVVRSLQISATVAQLGAKNFFRKKCQNLRLNVFLVASNACTMPRHRQALQARRACFDKQCSDDENAWNMYTGSLGGTTTTTDGPGEQPHVSPAKMLLAPARKHNIWIQY